MKTKSKKLKIIAALTVVIVLVTACAAILTACSGGGGENVNSSGTNVQIEGIDEADIVKVTDDGYIFKVQSDGVTISKAQDGHVELVKKAAFENFGAKEMFLFNDILVIIGSTAQDYVYEDFAYRKHSATVIKYYRFDTGAESEEIELVRETAFDGNFFTGRIADGKMYIVTEIINSSASNKKYTDSLKGERTINYVEAGARGFIVAKIDMTDITSNYLSSLFRGNLSDVYCSPYAIYLLQQNSNREGCDSFISYTKILKVSFETLTVENEIESPGYIPHRFAFHDNGENLFIVNQVFYRNGGDSLEPGTYVCAYGKDLTPVSMAGPYAPGESLYAVRYDENYCYLVTYRQVDPLFKIDISDPGNMYLLGELKIDGYSTYLQNFGTGLMAGVGFETDRNTQTGVKVTLFDITGDYPEEVNSIVIPNGNSEATANHKAILCSPSKNIFAFPALSMDSQRQYIQGAYIYGLVGGEFVERAFLTNFSEKFTATSIEIMRKYITRIVWIGDYLYTISDGAISSYRLYDFSYIGTCSTKINTFTVTYKNGDDVYHSETVGKGECAVPPQAPEMPGYMFIGWFKANGIKYNFNNTVNESFTLYARWENAGGV